MVESVSPESSCLLSAASSGNPSPSLDIPSPSPLLRIEYPSPPLRLPAPPPPVQTQSLSLSQWKSGLSFLRPAIRVTSEFDSDSFVFFHKLSCKFFDSLAKLKLAFQNNARGEIADLQLAFVSKHLSVHYDPEEHNAFVKSSFDLGDRMQFRAALDVKAQQGVVDMVANIGDPAYKFELSSVVPPVGLPRATFKFPLGEVSLEERDEEVKRALSVSGVVTSRFLDGKCTTQYKDENLHIRHSYKDEELSFIPSISLPSNSLSFAFKRRFGPCDKLSYRYDFDSGYWSAVYKHTVWKDYKLKAGYDSEVRLCWASLWVGDEVGKARAAPLKMKTQLMLQVPQDDFSSSILMLRVKKRWDI